MDSKLDMDVFLEVVLGQDFERVAVDLTSLENGNVLFKTNPTEPNERLLVRPLADGLVLDEVQVKSTV